MNYHKADKTDKNLRQAILEAYEGHCAYCTKNLLITEMDIDHIIPSKPNLQDNDTKKMIEKLEEEGFIYDSLENFAPVHSHENKEKSNKVWSPTELLIPRNTAKGKIEKILDIKKKLDNQKKACKKLPNLRNYISGDQKLAEAFYDDVMSEEDFDDCNEYIEDEEFCCWRRSIKRVSLYAVLPKVSSRDISCMFNFRALGIRECLITLEQEEIINMLFSGNNTKSYYENRSFIIGAKDDNFNYVQIGNCRFPITNDEVTELCKIVDELFVKYIANVIKLEERNGSIRFKYSREIKGYKLLSVERSLWDKLIKFSWDYDWDNGESEWHIFNANSNCIQVTLDRGHSINVELKPVIFGSYVDIYWREGFRPNFKFTFNDKEKWKVDYTYDWIVNEFIPFVLYKEYKDNKLFSSFISFDKYRREILNFSVDNDFFTKCNIKNIKNRNDLIDYISMVVNSLYDLEDTLFIDEEEIQSLLVFIERDLTTFYDFDITEVKRFISISNQDVQDNDSIIKNIILKFKSINDNMVSRYLLSKTFEMLLYVNYNSRIDIEERALETLLKPLEKFDSFLMKKFLAKKYL